MTFRVGQKVVCVDDVGKNCHRIAKDGVYTIHSINDAEVCWLRLVEAAPERGGFNARRFRPVVERKTDISIFTRMLKPQKESV